jgi:hypothetical protein
MKEVRPNLNSYGFRLPACVFHLVFQGLLAFVLTFSVLCIAAGTAQAKTDDEIQAAPDNRDAASAAKGLISRDALTRQRSAEQLAQIADPDWQRLVEGYRLQEGDSRVKLALDWALYRMGKTETLYSIVRALDSSRNAQAQRYLTTLVDPQPLHIFLDNANDKVRIRLFEVFARNGNAETVERLKPYAASLLPKVAAAAEASIREINNRLAQVPNDAPTRPRRVGNVDEIQP